MGSQYDGLHREDAKCAKISVWGKAAKLLIHEEHEGPRRTTRLILDGKEVYE